jgi:hypothetical protein
MYVVAGSCMTSYTFQYPVTCCHLLPNRTILVGLTSIPSYVLLSLLDEKTSLSPIDRSVDNTSLWRL